MYFASLPSKSFFFVSGSSKASFSPGRRKLVCDDMWQVNFTKVSVLIVGGYSVSSKHLKLDSIVPINKSEMADLCSTIGPDELEADASAAASIPGT